MKQEKSVVPSLPVKHKKGIILILCLYVALVALSLIVLCRLMVPLRQRLVEYEAAQLENQCAQVFEKLFANPDWERLYDLSDVEDTRYEGAEAYAAYMKAKVGSEELTFHETYTGIFGVHQYNVCLGDEKVAAFTLTGSTGSPAEIPQWTLDRVELFFVRTVHVTVEKKPEYTVYINGAALDDSFTIRSTATKAEQYLPEGIHGFRREWQCVDGLLVQPEVLVLDENGEAVAMVLDDKTGIYTMQLPDAPEMTDAEKTLICDAAAADAQFSMGGIKAAELRKYFDADSQVYADIVDNPIFIQSNKGFSIDESSVEVSEYFRYTDDLFSANVKLTVNVVRKDNTVKVYELDKTYFFTQNDSGDYLVSGYTNESVQERVEQVRLIFAVNDEEQTAFMTDCTADTVTVPEMAVAEGEELVGWATRTDDGSGTITMMVRILPNGTVLGDLEPMTLYPVFQATPEAG